MSQFKNFVAICQLNLRVKDVLRFETKEYNNCYITKD